MVEGFRCDSRSLGCFVCGENKFAILESASARFGQIDEWRMILSGRPYFLKSNGESIRKREGHRRGPSRICHIVHVVQSVNQ